MSEGVEQLTVGRLRNIVGACRAVRAHCSYWLFGQAKHPKFAPLVAQRNDVFAHEHCR